jgi:hypothetical protein
MQLRMVAALGVASLAAALSCKEPTQTTVLVRTNVPYRANVSMALWSSSTGSFPLGAVPQVTSADPWLDDGTLGDVVIAEGIRKRGAYPACSPGHWAGSSGMLGHGAQGLHRGPTEAVFRASDALACAHRTAPGV